MSTHRDQIDFVGHKKLKLEHVHPESAPPINNIILDSEKEEHRWIVETTNKIGDWRAIFRSSYIAWAVSVNGLFVAEEKYSDPKWSRQNEFVVRALRLPNGKPEQVSIAKWPGARAADAHISVAPVLLAYGFVDLYGCIEAFVFDFYSIYLNHNPSTLLQGAEFRELRRLRRKKEADNTYDEEWSEKWQERLNAWQRKRAYDGLDSVFLAYCNVAGLKEPANFEHTTPKTWAESIKGFGILRNCIAHGVRSVPAELAEFSRDPYSAAFDFQEGDPIEVKLYHLQSIELFTEQLLNALNQSLLERAGIDA